MDQISEGSLLWEPSPKVIENANLTHYMKWLNQKYDLTLDNYPALWQWSVDNLELFWDTLWDYFALIYSKRARLTLTSREMPGTVWFDGAELNFAENVIAKMAEGRPILLYKAEGSDLVAIERDEILVQVKAFAQMLKQLGVEPGDRVVAFLPNIPEAVISVLAVASLGAVWSSCPPDFGSRSVLDRFSQIEPAVLVAVDGYAYGGKLFDRRSELKELQKSLPSLKKTILIPFISPETADLSDTILWREVMAAGDADAKLEFTQVSFSHPLWILYSSGTTGLPKPIVHGHGGILLELIKNTTFHNDLRPDDRFFWYSSTGWMMWNYLVGSLLTGCTAVLYNGSPAYPDMNALWRLAEQAGITYFGTSAAFINACMKSGLEPSGQYDLRAIRSLGSTGSPLTVNGFVWIYRHINAHLALESLSGGTDLCTPFVGGAKIMSIYAGEIQAPALGAKVQSFNNEGQPVIDEVGELVITEPMPSMPLYFWGDPDFMRYRASYFEMFPGVWRHGDWIKINGRGGCIIYGRSDSTINRQGVRMGTSEIYQAIESLPEIQDSLIVDLELLGRDSYMPLFVVLSAGVSLNDDLAGRIKQKLRTDVSPRHVPDEIFVIEEVPYTLSGKKMEVPVRRILLGHDVDSAVNRGAMRNPETVDYFIDFARDNV